MLERLPRFFSFQLFFVAFFFSVRLQLPLTEVLLEFFPFLVSLVQWQVMICDEEEGNQLETYSICFFLFLFVSFFFFQVSKPNLPCNFF